MSSFKLVELEDMIKATLHYMLYMNGTGPSNHVQHCNVELPFVYHSPQADLPQAEVLFCNKMNGRWATAAQHHRCYQYVVNHLVLVKHVYRP